MPVALTRTVHKEPEMLSNLHAGILAQVGGKQETKPEELGSWCSCGSLLGQGVCDSFGSMFCHSWKESISSFVGSPE